MPVDKQQFDSILVRLSSMEFDVFREGLKEMITERLSDLSYAEEPKDIYRLQGEIRSLRKVLGLVTKKRG